MYLSQLENQPITRELADQIVYAIPDYNGETAPCALVLGSTKGHIYRLPKAVELYHEGKVQKILLSGGAKWAFPSDDDFSIAEGFPGCAAFSDEKISPEGKMSEADRMQFTALKLGVKPEDLLLDNLSMTTIENMVCSLVTLEKSIRLYNISEIILVTTSYHMRRSLGLARMLFPKWIRIIPCPTEDQNTRRSNWWESEASTKRVHNEVDLMIQYIKKGIMEDFEI